MKYILYYSLLVFIFMGLCSCKEKDGGKPMEPLEISNLRADTSTPGQIILHWDRGEITESADIKYVIVTYYDPYIAKQVKRLASSYADSILIPKTFKSAGTYHFSLEPVSSSDKSASLQTIDVEAAALPQQVSYEKEAFPLSADMLSTNAQEPNEGPIANLVDGRMDTFFHTAWSKSLPEMHYFVVSLGEAIQNFAFNFYTRHNGNGAGDVKRMQIWGSNDNDSWTLIKEIAFELPRTLGAKQEADVILSPQAYSYLKFIPTATRVADPLTNSWFNMAELEFFKVNVNIVDPEKEAAEIIEANKNRP